MRVGKETNLNEGNRNRRIAPGLQLAAIDRQRRDPIETLGPLASLFMIGKLAPKGKHGGNVRARLIYRSQPGVKFEPGKWTPRQGGGHRWEEMFEGLRGREPRARR